MRSLLIKTETIETNKNFIEEVICDDPLILAHNPYPREALIKHHKYHKKQYLLEKYRFQEKEINFFIHPDDLLNIKSFLEDQIRQAMAKTGYDDARRFQQIKESYGDKFSKLLVKGVEDPLAKQQLKRMLDF